MDSLFRRGGRGGSRSLNGEDEELGEDHGSAFLRRGRVSGPDGAEGEGEDADAEAVVERGREGPAVDCERGVRG